AGSAKLVKQRVADGLKVEAMFGDHRARLDDDGVDVADLLEPLVEILALQTQPFAEDLHKVDDLKAAPVADIAQLAMAGVVDRRQCRHPSIGDGGKFALDEFALEIRQDGETVGLGPDPRYIDLDQF